MPEKHRRFRDSLGIRRGDVRHLANPTDEIAQIPEDFGKHDQADREISRSAYQHRHKSQHARRQTQQDSTEHGDGKLNRRIAEQPCGQHRECSYPPCQCESLASNRQRNRRPVLQQLRERADSAIATRQDRHAARAERSPRKSEGCCALRNSRFGSPGCCRYSIGHRAGARRCRSRARSVPTWPRSVLRPQSSSPPASACAKSPSASRPFLTASSASAEAPWGTPPHADGPSSSNTSACRPPLTTARHPRHHRDKRPRPRSPRA